jgi:hypothetical protein
VNAASLQGEGSECCQFLKARAVNAASLQGEGSEGVTSLFQGFWRLIYQLCHITLSRLQTLFSMSACIGQHFPERPGQDRPLDRNLEVVASGKYFRRLPPAQAALPLPHLPPFQGNRILNQHINANPLLSTPSSSYTVYSTKNVPFNRRYRSRYVRCHFRAQRKSRFSVPTFQWPL